MLCIHEHEFTKLSAFPPGSMGQNMTTQHILSHQIGSISLKICYLGHVNISFLFFSNNKIKVSGGLSKLDPDGLSTDDFWTFVQQILIIPILNKYINDTFGYDIRFISGMFNANIKSTKKISMPTYMNVLHALEKHYGKHNIVLPAMFNEGKKGRICAVKLKVNGTIMFDYTCNIQTFGYRSLEKLEIDIDEVWNIIFP